MHDTHLGKCFAWTPVLITYNDISAQVEKENGVLGASPPEKLLLATPFRLLENAFSASSSNC